MFICMFLVYLMFKLKIIYQHFFQNFFFSFFRLWSWRYMKYFTIQDKDTNSKKYKWNSSPTFYYFIAILCAVFRAYFQTIGFWQIALFFLLICRKYFLLCLTFVFVSVYFCFVLLTRNQSWFSYYNSPNDLIRNSRKTRMFVPFAVIGRLLNLYILV